MKNNYKILYSIIFLTFITLSCSKKPKTDAQLLEKDKANLVKLLDSYSVLAYKFSKIMLRASTDKTSSSPEITKFKNDLKKVSINIFDDKNTSKQDLSIKDYIAIAKGFKEVSSYIAKTDEDNFPTLTESFAKKETQPLTKEEKIQLNNIEHILFSAGVLLSGSFGTEISLYESSKINLESMPEIELKTALKLYKGFLFYKKDLYFLSRKELTQNINWLDSNPNIDLPKMQFIFEKLDIDGKHTHKFFRAINFLIRGISNLSTQRDADKKLAIQDFKVFLNDSKSAGIDNEITWIIETYVYLVSHEKEKAIISLNKLKNSKISSEEDKETIDKLITYVKKRKSGKILNGLRDKIFLIKIGVKFALSSAKKLDWEKILKQQNIVQSDEIFTAINKFKKITQSIEKYSNNDNLKKIGKEAGEKVTNEIKNQSENIWNKAKDLVK